MTILINQTPVEFTLESETTVGEVARSLQTWAQSQGLAVVSLLADGRADFDALPVDGVEVLAAETVALADWPAQKAEVLAGYFRLVAEAGRRGSHADLELLAQDFPLVQEGVREILGEGPLASAVWARPWNADVGPVAAELASALEAWQGTWKSPEAALKRAGDALSRHLKTLTSLSAWFQQGQDSAAFDAILGLFTRVEELRRASSDVPGEATMAWNRALDEISPFLGEIRDALDAQDYILLTDVLEYEVLPRLQAVLPVWQT